MTKPRLPKSRDASFGDEVLVADNSVGCPTEEAYERWLNTVLEKGDENALGGGAGRLSIDQQRHGRSHRLSAACVRPNNESECVWISDSRISVTNPSNRH